MSSQLFKEDQHFHPLLVWLVIVLGFVPIAFILGSGVYKQLILGEPWGNSPMSDLGLLLLTLTIFALLVGLLMLLQKSRLQTEVTKWNIRYRFSPLIPAWKEIPKENLKSYGISKFTIFRGFGVRWSIQGVKTLNARGTQGVELHYEENKRLIIGSQQPELFIKALDKMMSPDTE